MSTPLHTAVALSDGREVLVGRVKFGALAELAGSPALGKLLDAAREPSAGDAGRLAMAVLPGLVEIGLRWSTEPRIEPSDLAAADARTLFEAFLKQNPPDELMAELKKWLGPVMGPLTRALASLTPTGSNGFST